MRVIVSGEKLMKRFLTAVASIIELPVLASPIFVAVAARACLTRQRRSSSDISSRSASPAG